MPLGLLDLALLIESEAPFHSYDHGPQHWRCVAKSGILLAREVPEADPLVCCLFGMLHDSRRLDDGHDPEHGPRAAHYADQLFDRGLLPVTRTQFDTIRFACLTHTEAGPTEDLRVGTCYDADRLNLWRVGITPEPKYLSTEPGRTRRWISRTESWHFIDLTWAEVLALLD